MVRGDRIEPRSPLALLRELYDVQVLRGVRCPKAIGLQNKEIWGVVTFGTEDGRMVRHTDVVED